MVSKITTPSLLRGEGGLKCYCGIELQQELDFFYVAQIHPRSAISSNGIFVNKFCSTITS